MRRRILTLILALALMASLSACGGNPSVPVNTEAVNSDTAAETPSPEAATAPPEESPEPKEPDFSAAYADYLRILRNNKRIISAYNQPQGNGTVAFADVIGDATPELFYITMPAGYTAYLNVWTYEDEQAVQVMYSARIDEFAGGGFSYCLFTTTDGKLFLYSSGGGEPWVYSFAQYEIGVGDEDKIIAEGILSTAKNISHKKTPSDDYKTTTHVYSQNGAEITESEYESLTNAIIGSMNNVILSGGMEDGPIGDKAAKTDSLAMSYDAAIAYLKDNVSSTRAADNPFTEEEAIAFMVPVILEEWGDYVSESTISDGVSYDIMVSTKLFNEQPIYLVVCSLHRIGSSVALVFADGNTINRYDAEFSAYNDYFATDITTLQ